MREIIRNSFDVVVYEPEQTSEWGEAYERFREILLMEYDDEQKSKN
jgi:hypothetical protein